MKAHENEVFPAPGGADTVKHSALLTAVVAERGIACFKHGIPELSVPWGVQIVSSR